MLSIAAKFYRPSIYRVPFFSARVGPFWFVHDWHPYGAMVGGGKKVEG